MFKMFKALVAPTLAAVFCASTAGATTIQVQTFDYTDFATYTQNAVIEDFESLNAAATTFEDSVGIIANGIGGNGQLFGEIASSLSTSVGSFTTAGGTGSGSTCQNLSLGNNTCDNIALQYDPDLNGQGNIVPVDGHWSLNAADTTGIIWNASLNGNALFNTLVFAIQDGADQGHTVLTVSTGNHSLSTVARLPNNNRQLYVVTFGGDISSATITIANENGRVNDSFSLDGAAIVPSGGPNGGPGPSPVPLPAGVWLLLTGLGGLAFARRRTTA